MDTLYSSWTSSYFEAKAHSSKRNTTQDRRIGIAIRYTTPEVRQTKVIDEKDSALLVRGKDKFNNFIHEIPPKFDLDKDAIANHKIISLKKNNKKFSKNIEFVGPVCESSDTFLKQKNFSKIKVGDCVAITDVGAYGMSLASNYNARPLIAEVMISGSKHKLIRKRQSLENLISN